MNDMERRIRYLKTYLAQDVEIIVEEGGSFLYQSIRKEESDYYTESPTFRSGDDTWEVVTARSDVILHSFGGRTRRLYIDYVLSKNQDSLKVMHGSIECVCQPSVPSDIESAIVRCIVGLSFEYSVLAPYFVQDRHSRGKESLISKEVRHMFVDAVCDLSHVDFFVESLA